jgi:hypothetical protein
MDTIAVVGCFAAAAAERGKSNVLKQNQRDGG